jgi:hypothetical protein
MNEENYKDAIKTLSWESNLQKCYLKKCL